MRAVRYRPARVPLLGEAPRQALVQYTLGRSACIDDRESLEDQTKDINKDDKVLRAFRRCVDSEPGIIRQCIVGAKAKFL